jgi:hypothetical protein
VLESLRRSDEEAERQALALRDGHSGSAGAGAHHDREAGRLEGDAVSDVWAGVSPGSDAWEGLSPGSDAGGGAEDGGRLVAHLTVDPERSMVKLSRQLRDELEGLEERYASLLGGAAAEETSAAEARLASRDDDADADTDADAGRAAVTDEFGVGALEDEVRSLSRRIVHKSRQVSSLEAAVREVRAARERSPASDAASLRARAETMRSFESVQMAAGRGVPASSPSRGAGRAGGVALNSARRARGAAEGARQAGRSGSSSARRRSDWRTTAEHVDSFPMWAPIGDESAEMGSAVAQQPLTPPDRASAIVGGGPGRPAGGSFRQF